MCIRDRTSISTVPRGCAWQVFESVLHNCEVRLATGLHIVGSGICALLEMRAETVQKWTSEIQWKR